MEPRLPGEVLQTMLASAANSLRATLMWNDAMTATALAEKRVLVVEDEILVAMLIEDILVSEGSQVIGPCHTLAEAMRASETEAMDLAVLDVNLRGEKIFPVAKMLEARGVPFLLLSGYGDNAVPAEHRHWEICAKPFDTDVLLDRMSRLASQLPKA